MVKQKPLPELPTGPELTTLSVEARNHRARLIKYFLNDLHEPSIESRRDGWLYAFEEALDDLGRHISSGNWLSSIRRGKKRKKSTDAQESNAAQKATNVHKSTEDQEGADNQKGDANQEFSNAFDNEAEPATSATKPQPEAPFKLLRTLASRPVLPQGESRIGHFVLCLTPHGSRLTLPAEDSGFDIVPANIGCMFTAGSFSLQDSADDEVGTVLYGLEGLNANTLDPKLRLVGGTFTLKGVNSPVQHHLLFKALKLAVYAHLCLILEQYLLLDSGVHLKYPRPKFPPPSPSSPARTPLESPGASEIVREARMKSRNSILPSSFANFFAKRNLSYRGAQTIGTAAGGSRSGGSLDLTIAVPSSSSAGQIAPEAVTEGAFGGLRLRRFSFMGADRHHSFLKPLYTSSPEKSTATSPQPFVNALKRIEESRDLLSTSAGVSFGLPKVIVELAEKEKAKLEGQGPGWRLKGDEKAALTSLLGWNGKEAEGRGMSGILGFVRQQEISVLCSQHVPPSSTGAVSSTSSSPPPIAATSSISSAESNARGSSAFTNPTTSPAISSNIPAVHLSPCGKPHWITYQYFSSTDGGDLILGEWILAFAKGRNTPCTRPGCSFVKGQHESRLMHDGVRIVIRVTEEESAVEDEEKEEGEDQEMEKPKEPEDKIEVWESCAVCDAKTPRRTMSDGTFLFSYAKFLEILIYSPTMCTLTPPICQHTTPSPNVGSRLPSSRLNIVRHFTVAGADITFALSTIEDIFELKVPRLQITRGVERTTPPSTSAGRIEGSTSSTGTSEPKRILRREIRKWWEGVSDHIDSIEKVLNTKEVLQKALPRLPSIDDAYESFEEPADPDSTSGPTTPTPSTPFPLPPLPPTTPRSPSQEDHQGSYFTTLSSMSTDTHASKTPTVPTKDKSEQLLASLRHNFQRIEHSLYAQLAKTPDSSLNDVRRSFIATGKGTKKRLHAWQAKHLGSSKSKLVGDLVAEEPEWWEKGSHAVPGGNVIVRENDWGSIIAHTLSTVDYQLEMANMSAVRSATSAPPTTPSDAGTSSSFFSVATGYRLFTSSSKNQPDPDQEHVVWNEPEQYSAVISRKEHGRDPTSLLSIRDVLRQKATPEQPNGLSSGSRFVSIAQAAGPAAVKAKADVALNTEAAGGKVNGAEGVDKGVDKVLQALDEATPTTSKPASVRSEALSSSSSGLMDTHIRRGKASSIISRASADSQLTIGKDDDVKNDGEPKNDGESKQPGDLKGGESKIDGEAKKAGDSKQDKEPKKEVDIKKDLEELKLALTLQTQSSFASLPPPIPPPKDDLPTTPKPPPPAAPDSKHLPSSHPPPSRIVFPSDGTPSPPPPTSSGFASALATGLNSAMRYVLSTEPPSRSMTPAPSSAKKHHGLLLAEMSNIDERPHIKYDWTIGKRIKFSCTVYYAKQFDLLRKRCGINDVFLKSISRSMNWSAEGGKSKSNFWKTSDDRFIIKTLVNAWNVADLQVLIELAPSYFRYMDATASKPTVLAKLIGFYTVEIKNLETGAVQSKADLLVMENLFFEQNVSKTFDLKGIQGRKVKTQGDTTKTLFDGEWIEGQQRTLTLVRPYSKAILRDALRSDAEFLSKSNIMDYSLLLGIDEEKKQIACGLVDTIGSYTFAKTLEYKAKQGLQSGKEVTVMPPGEYQERFVSALEGYFVACPDKWSKPLDESKIISDPQLLPSVL